MTREEVLQVLAKGLYWHPDWTLEECNEKIKVDAYAIKSALRSYFDIPFEEEGWVTGDLIVAFAEEDTPFRRGGLESVGINWTDRVRKAHLTLWPELERLRKES